MNLTPKVLLFCTITSFTLAVYNWKCFVTDLLTLEILTYAYRLTRNLTDLVRGDDMAFDGLMCKYNLEDTISTIKQLNEDEDLTFYRNIPTEIPFSSEKQLCYWQEVEMDIQQLYHNELEHSPMFYSLTQKGGEKWEGLFQADWNNFLIRGSTGAENYGLSINLSLLEEWIALVSAIHYVDNENIRFEKISPFQLTYWKTVEFGYGVDYQIIVDRSRGKFRPESEFAAAKERNLGRGFWSHYISLVNDVDNTHQSV